MSMKGSVVGVVIVIAAFLALAVTAAPTMGSKHTGMTVSGFRTPESALYDPRADVYLVANINGNPTGVDGNGFISRVSPSGRVLALKWIDGTKQGVTLNAPKGMAVSGATLYVADITAVRMFDRSSGRFKGSIDIMGATFLNDLDAGTDGQIFVTDTGLKPDFSPSGTDAVYRIDGQGKVTTVAKGTDLHNPNGLAVLPNGRVLVVTWTEKGEVYTLGADGSRQGVRNLGPGQLDGVEPVPGGFLVSSWATSAVYRVAGSGMPKAVFQNMKAPADIGYDSKRNRVLIPMFMDNKLVIQPLK
jgi:DNA-binding beta-propeller fold protein YncE